MKKKIFGGRFGKSATITMIIIIIHSKCWWWRWSWWKQYKETQKLRKKRSWKQDINTILPHRATYDNTNNKKSVLKRRSSVSNCAQCFFFLLYPHCGLFCSSSFFLMPNCLGRYYGELYGCKTPQQQLKITHLKLSLLSYEITTPCNNNITTTAKRTKVAFKPFLFITHFIVFF